MVFFKKKKNILHKLAATMPFIGNISTHIFNNHKLDIIKLDNNYLFSAYDIFKIINKKLIKKRIIRRMPLRGWIKKTNIIILNEQNFKNKKKKDLFFNIEGIKILLKWFPDNDMLIEVVCYINKLYNFISEHEMNKLIYS